MSPSFDKARPLKVAVLSSASGGGAGIAARRVTDALNLGDDMQADFIDMVALSGRMPDDAAPPGNMNNRKITDTHFTVEFPGYVRGWIIELLEQYDVLNVHWASYLLGLSELDELSRRGTPILFTCHDYYYFTGGCHYPASCQTRLKGCVACPQVDTTLCSTTVIAQNLKLKRAILSRPNVHLSAPSAFLTGEAIRADMITEDRAHVLRNAYFPANEKPRLAPSPRARIALIADSLSERRKGMPLAVAALACASEELSRGGTGTIPFLVDVIGNADHVLHQELTDSGVEFKLHGKVTDHSALVDILSQCDCLLTCSYEDNWPNVLVEAGAYGVLPIVGPGHGCEEFSRYFDIHYVATGYSKNEFATVIVKAIEERSLVNRERFAQRVREIHDPARVADDYASIIKPIAAFADHSVDKALMPNQP